MSSKSRRSKKSKNRGKNNVPRYRLHEIDLRSIDPDCTVVVIGKRKSGKSLALRQLLYEINPRRGCCFTGSKKGAKFFSRHFPSSYVYYGFDSDSAKRILFEQSCISEDKEFDPTVDNECVFVMDDLSFDTAVMRDQTLKQLFQNGRHDGIGVWMSAQYIMDLPCPVRQNCDYAFFFAEVSVDVRKKLWKNYFAVFPTYAEFNSVFNSCTKNHGALVIHTVSSSPNVSDCVFWFRADEDLPDFVIGDDDYKTYDHIYGLGNNKMGKEQRDRQRKLMADPNAEEPDNEPIITLVPKNYRTAKSQSTAYAKTTMPPPADAHPRTSVADSAHTVNKNSSKPTTPSFHQQSFRQQFTHSKQQPSTNSFAYSKSAPKSKSKTAKDPYDAPFNLSWK